MIDQLCKWIANGMTKADACRLCNLSETAFYGWIKKHEMGEGTELHDKLVESLKKAEAQFKAVHVNNIIQAGKEKRHWQASAWLLERKYPKEYGKIDRNAVMLTADDGELAEVAEMFQRLLKDEDDGD